MKFGQRHSIRKNLKPVEFAKGIWNPGMRQWRDVIEDYLYISQKRTNNKLCMFRLQLNIFGDIATNIKQIDQYKNLEKQTIEEENNETISKEDLEHQKQHIKSEIFTLNCINKALREIVDGIVWKYFNYNRAILYMLADKQPIETLRIGKGTINNLYEFSDVFLKHDSFAIYNDITNFLRIGDITQISEDGNIEFVEVKTKKQRGSRITRQKKRMEEVVQFFNTGHIEYEGKALKILDSKIKQKNYLKLLKNSIKKAKYKGFSTLLIGEYLILEIVDYSLVKSTDDFISYFESAHGSIQRKWNKNQDFIYSPFFLDKMDYSKNCAPFSIYPFDIETRADIIMGKLMINVKFNFSELLRIIERAGWNIKETLISKSKEELNSLYGKNINEVSLLKISKEKLTLDVPPSLIARMQYELLAPSTLLAFLEDIYNKGPQENLNNLLTNNIDEQRIWK